jgi:catechol 2,3-dioxygenase-like lactoylglutathione lyase family enzyme
MKNGQGPARKMDLNHLHLHVRNVDRSKLFYESYFGFRERVRHGNILFLRNTSGFDLAVVPDRTPLSFPEWFHFGFRLGSARAVRMLHDHMSSKGGQVQDIEEYPGYMTFRCTDPDGYGIEVYWE